MNDKIGRNDPCPCGSGKKYKHCCLGREDAEAVPLKTRNSDDAFQRYREISLSLGRKAKPAAPAAKRGRSGHADEAMHSLREKMGKREFRSEKELKKFLNQNLAEINNAPHKDFLGLSPAQVHASIQSGISRENPVVAMHWDIPPELMETAPGLAQCRYLLQEIGGDEKGIKATPKGNLTHTAVQRFYDRFIRVHDIVPAVHPREEEVKEIHRARFFLIDTGYIILRHGAYVVTDKGREALNDPAPGAIYRELFLYNAERYNWLYGTRYPDVLGFLQQTIVFCLYVAKHRAKRAVLGDTLALQYRKAFPSLVAEMGPDHGDLFLRAGFCHLFCDEFAWYLGLMEKEGGSGKFLSREFLFKTTPLFRELFRWKA